MPNGDRTGPTGQGPQTGRKLGFCAGNKTPGRITLRKGRGRRYGCGRRRGRNRGWFNWI